MLKSLDLIEFFLYGIMRDYAGINTSLMCKFCFETTDVVNVRYYQINFFIYE